MSSEDQLARAHEAIAQLQRLTELFAQRRVALARSVGLTEQQWRVLEEISTEHFMPSMFARARESSPAAVSKILRQLTDKGLVSAKIAGGDARQREYALTKAGLEIIARLREARGHAIRRIWLKLDEAQLTQFIATSAQLVTDIENFSAAESTPPGTASALR